MDSLLRNRKWWSEEEDRILCSEAGQYVNKNDLWDWSSIAAKLDGRTNKDCRKRWLKISQGVNKGAWTKSEDARLKKAVERYGCRWTDVAKFVETRHADQCSKRWQHSLDPSLSHLPWTTKEYKTLHDAVQRHGRKWKYISDHILVGRSSTDLKNRYVIIERLQSQNAPLPWNTEDDHRQMDTPEPEYALQPQPHSHKSSFQSVYSSIEVSSALPTPSSVGGDLNIDPFLRLSMSPAMAMMEHQCQRDRHSLTPFDVDSDIDMSGYATPLDQDIPSYNHADMTIADLQQLSNPSFAMDNFRLQNMTPHSDVSAMELHPREITSAPRFYPTTATEENVAMIHAPVPELACHVMSLDKLEQGTLLEAGRRRVILDGVETETLTAIVELLFQKQSKLNMRVEEDVPC